VLLIDVGGLLVLVFFEQWSVFIAWQQGPGSPVSQKCTKSLHISKRVNVLVTNGNAQNIYTVKPNIRGMPRIPESHRRIHAVEVHRARG
jgi:hypothetical protein